MCKVVGLVHLTFQATDCTAGIMLRFLAATSYLCLLQNVHSDSVPQTRARGGALYPEINRTRCETDHSPPSNAEVKNVCSCIASSGATNFPNTLGVTSKF
jgi:hypothetical protein